MHQNIEVATANDPIRTEIIHLRIQEIQEQNIVLTTINQSIFVENQSVQNELQQALQLQPKMPILCDRSISPQNMQETQDSRELFLGSLLQEVKFYSVNDANVLETQVDAVTEPYTKAILRRFQRDGWSYSKGYSDLDESKKKNEKTGKNQNFGNTIRSTDSLNHSLFCSEGSEEFKGNFKTIELFSYKIFILL